MSRLETYTKEQLIEVIENQGAVIEAQTDLIGKLTERIEEIQNRTSYYIEKSNMLQSIINKILQLGNSIDAIQESINNKYFGK